MSHKHTHVKISRGLWDVMVTRAFNLKRIGVENDAHSTCIYMYDELSKFTGIGTNIREIGELLFATCNGYDSKDIEKNFRNCTLIMRKKVFKNNHQNHSYQSANIVAF